MYTFYNNRKKPVIEVVGARPMSEVGFRDMSASKRTPANPAVPERSTSKQLPPRPGTQLIAHVFSENAICG